MTEEFAVIYNPTSGNADRLDEVREAFDDRGVRTVWLETTADDPGEGLARDAADRGVSVVVAVGGDGTVRSCALGLVDAGVPLAIIPLGTGNVVARSLDIPLDPTDAVDTAVSGDTIRVDIGLANGEPFVATAGIGLDAHLVADADREAKARLGPVAYVLSALRHIRRRPFRIDAPVGPVGSIKQIEAAMVLAANVGSFPGLDLFPDADPSDGKLEVMIVEAGGVWSWIGAIGDVLMRRRSDRVHRWTADSLEVSTTLPQPMEVDGDVQARTDRLVLSVRPQSLSVRVPPSE